MSRLSVFLFLLLSSLDGLERASAAVVYTFQGGAFTLRSTPFTTSDFITGSATFNSVGDPVAESLSLSVTINSSPGYTLSHANTVNKNVFDWVGSSITAWEVDLSGNVFSGAQDETLSISNALGDTAAIDFPGGAVGNTFSPGTWSATAVPEPSMFIAMSIAAIGVATRIRNSRKR